MKQYFNVNYSIFLGGYTERGAIMIAATSPEDAMEQVKELLDDEGELYKIHNCVVNQSGVHPDDN